MDPESSLEIEGRLVALIRSAGPLRAAVAEIAGALVGWRAWERLGYARIQDYADERVGRSARSLQDLARVGRALRGLPRLRDALGSGRLGWTRTRLVARVAMYEDEETWIETARGMTAQALSHEVRRVDRGSVETGGLERDSGPSRLFEVTCTPEVRARWAAAQAVARRVHGGRLHPSGCAEMIAAEVASALPLGPQDLGPEEMQETRAGPWAEAIASPVEQEPPRPEPDQTSAPAAISPEIEALLRDLDDADAFEIDRRLRLAVSLEQRLDAAIGPLLEVVLRHRMDRAWGYASRDRYVCERLGLDPSWTRTLLRIERAARASPVFARAYRGGRITALQARTLAPLVTAEIEERWIEGWVERARGYTLRRLRDDVEQALLVCETDDSTWLQTGGLPVEAPPGAEAAAGPAAGAWEIGAQPSAPRETCEVRCIVDADVGQMLRAALCSVRRRIEAVTGRLPTPGEALGAMLEHVLAVWGAGDPRLRRSYAIFTRDGWRCAIPGCTSMRNLHEHHIVFRAAGGSDDPTNLLTLCAFHHQRGVHAGRILCTGQAPDRLRITLGVRPGLPPLATYVSGDSRVPA